MTTVAGILRQLSDSQAIALKFGDSTWTYQQLVQEAARRSALLDDRLDPSRPPHIGVLLDNVPEYLFWLAAAALSASVVVGINSTYRGDQLGLLIRHTDCQILVTATAHEQLLDGVTTAIAPDQVLFVDSLEYVAEVAGKPVAAPDLLVTEDDLFLLIFTSGSTGLPKAVRCTQGRFARTGAHVTNIESWAWRRRLLSLAVLSCQLTVHRLVRRPQRRDSHLHADQVLRLEHAG